MTARSLGSHPTSGVRPPRRRPGLGLGRRLVVALLAMGWLCCSAAQSDLRPSVLLIVIDTLRADAVSAYGQVEGTTPHIDALAREGLVYTNAFAPSPWTLPSHASLFTGVGPEVHGVGLHGRMALPEGPRTLAEAMTTAGYATAGFAENPLISEAFGMTRGFERFCALSVKEVLTEMVFQEGLTCDVEKLFGRFLELESGRPFFAFVNLYDAHAPYTDREVNRFVPSDVPMLWSENELAAISQRLCDALPTSDDLKALRGLYLGDVAAADAKVGRLVGQARAASGSRQLIVVVTSDHGELLGERRLLDHEFTLNGSALHIPLVVSGLDAAPAARIDTPVTLADLPASILGWTQVDTEVGGTRVLPTRAGEPAAVRDLVAWYSDALLQTPEVLGKGVAGAPGASDYKRSRCTESDRVFGDLIAVTRWPHKLVWYQRYSPPELYDLSWDPLERSDQHAYQPDLAESLAEVARGWFAEYTRAPDAALVEPSQAELEALRGLGYLEPKSEESR